MDELFGEVGFAAADMARKEKIERDIGLTALLGGPEAVAGSSDDDMKAAEVTEEVKGAPAPQIPEVSAGKKE